MTIIPAIDIIDGKCVRLTRGDYSQKKIYNEDPVSIALHFHESGFQRLHLVDLDGAQTGNVKNWKVLENIAGNTNLKIDFSGGISSQENVETAFNAGAYYVAVGSKAVKDEVTFIEWLNKFGVERFIIGADVKNEMITIKGWAEQTNVSVYDLIEKYKMKGVKIFFCTDVNKDGLLNGPSIDLYKKIISKHPTIDLIASGGVSSIADVEKLKNIGCAGVIIGKALYENKISLPDLKYFL